MGLVGSSYVTFDVDISAGLKHIDELEARAKQAVDAIAKQPSALPSTGGGSAPAAQAANTTQLVRAQAALDAQSARLARSQGDTARATDLETAAFQRLSAQLVRTDITETESIALQRQLTSLQQQTSQTTNIATQFGTAFKSSLLGIIGPTALVATGFGAARAAVDSFVDAYKFTAQLDATNLSIRTQLGEVRDASAAFDEAAKFGVRYRLTQQDTAQAIQASIPILRSSNASLTDVESTLLRLQSKKPEKSIADAARALDELKSGQIVSIVDQFNVSRDSANKMKNEIQGGADAVQVLSKYLADAGIGMEVLENRAKGAQGKLNELAQAQERRQQAQGGASGGLGAFLTQSLAVANDVLTDTLSGNAAAYAAVQARDEAYTQAIREGKNATDARRIAHDAWALSIQKSNTTVTEATTVTTRLKDDTAAATNSIQAATLNMDDERRAAYDLAHGLQDKADAEKLAAVQAQTHAIAEQQVDDTARRAADAMIANGNAGAQAAALLAKSSSLIDRRVAAYYDLEKAALAAREAENAASVTKTLTTERFAGRSGGRGDSSDAAADAAASVAATKAQTAAQERQIDAQIALASAHGNTAKQIDLLRQKEKLYGKDEVDRQNIEAQIISLQKSAGKTRVDAAAATGLQLAQTEENSQAAILKAQREGQERLLDAAQDYNLSRSRKTEDFERDYRKLLAQGQRARAKDLKDEFDLSQKRAAEDFRTQTQRTNRNNAESTGDINNRTNLRQDQINDRAALRGVRPAGGAGGSAGSVQPSLSAPSDQAGAGKQMTLVVQVQQLPIQLDGKTIATASWAELREMFDTELSETLAALPPVGGGQSAVAGGRP